MNETTDFTSWRAFSEFERLVRTSRRYIRTGEAETFLGTIRRTVHLRRTNISKGRGLWRAQVGHSWRHIEEIDDDVPAPFPPDRMKPLQDRAMEGRANPKGIPMLYLCSSKDAAMSEVRPWPGSMISLGYFEIKHDLKLVNCSHHSEDGRIFPFEKPSVEDWNNIVWSDIDRAFTKPVTRSDDSSEYVATQILSELFRDAGFDGIAYRSAFGKKSINFVIFDLDCAELRSCQLHEVTSVNMNFGERDSPYWVRRSQPREQKASQRGETQRT